jgi:hypothetical protein
MYIHNVSDIIIARFCVRYLHMVGNRRSLSDSLRNGRSGDRILVGARFSSPVQTGSETYPASYTMGTGSFPGVKWPVRGVDRPHPSSGDAKKY